MARVSSWTWRSRQAAVPAKVQRSRASQLGRRCVETSVDVIRKILRANRGNLSRFFTRPGVHSSPLRGLCDAIDVRQITTLCFCPGGKPRPIAVFLGDWHTHGLGNMRVSRVDFGIPPKQGVGHTEKVHDGEDAIASTRDACATRKWESQRLPQPRQVSSSPRLPLFRPALRRPPRRPLGKYCDNTRSI